MGHYDPFAEAYHHIVVGKPPMIELSYSYVLEQLRPDISGKMVCDIGCGQGELSRRMEEHGAIVTGVDNSGKLLDIARNVKSSVQWLQDDAMNLVSLQEGVFDIVVSNLMLMDVPDFEAVFNESYRILVDDGIIVWVITHPCFQSPFSYPLEDGGRKVSHYSAQWWKSNGIGTIRGTLGAYHRPISDYLKGFMRAGFEIVRMDEPTVPTELIGDSPSSHIELPPILAIVGRKK